MQGSQLDPILERASVVVVSKKPPLAGNVAQAGPEKKRRLKTDRYEKLHQTEPRHPDVLRVDKPKASVGSQKALRGDDGVINIRSSKPRKAQGPLRQASKHDRDAEPLHPISRLTDSRAEEPPIQLRIKSGQMAPQTLEPPPNAPDPHMFTPSTAQAPSSPGGHSFSQKSANTIMGQKPANSNQGMFAERLAEQAQMNRTAQASMKFGAAAHAANPFEVNDHSMETIDGNEGEQNDREQINKELAEGHLRDNAAGSSVPQTFRPAHEAQPAGAAPNEFNSRKGSKVSSANPTHRNGPDHLRRQDHSSSTDLLPPAFPMAQFTSQVPASIQTTQQSSKLLAEPGKPQLNRDGSGATPQFYKGSIASHVKAKAGAELTPAGQPPPERNLPLRASGPPRVEAGGQGEAIIRTSVQQFLASQADDDDSSSGKDQEGDELVGRAELREVHEAANSPKDQEADPNRIFEESQRADMYEDDFEEETRSLNQPETLQATDRQRDLDQMGINESLALRGTIPKERRSQEGPLRAEAESPCPQGHDTRQGFIYESKTDLLELEHQATDQSMRTQCSKVVRPLGITEDRPSLLTQNRDQLQATPLHDQHDKVITIEDKQMSQSSRRSNQIRVYSYNTIEPPADSGRFSLPPVIKAPVEASKLPKINSKAGSRSNQEGRNEFDDTRALGATGPFSRQSGTSGRASGLLDRVPDHPRPGQRQHSSTVVGGGPAMQVDNVLGFPGGEQLQIPKLARPTRHRQTMHAVTMPPLPNVQNRPKKKEPEKTEKCQDPPYEDPLEASQPFVSALENQERRSMTDIMSKRRSRQYSNQSSASANRYANLNNEGAEPQSPGRIDWNQIQERQDSSRSPQPPILQQPLNADLAGLSPPPEQEEDPPQSQNLNQLSRESSQSSRYEGRSERHSADSQSSHPSSTTSNPFSPPMHIRPEQRFRSTLPLHLQPTLCDQEGQEEEKAYPELPIVLNKQLRSPDVAVIKSRIKIAKAIYTQPLKSNSSAGSLRSMPSTETRHGRSLKTLGNFRSRQLQDYISTNYIASSRESREKPRPRPSDYQVAQQTFRRSMAQQPGLKRRTSASRRRSQPARPEDDRISGQASSPPPRERLIELQIDKKKRSAYQIKVIDWNPVQKSIQRRQFRRTWKVQYDSRSSASLGDNHSVGQRK